MAPRRTSSRAASHDQASSPPKPDTSRRTATRSPQKRPARATRSQSRDLDEPYAPAQRRAGGRNERQGSVDSVGSNASAANNGRGKKVRGTAPIRPELSMVAEDEEMQGSLANEEEAHGLLNFHPPSDPMPGPSEILQSAQNVPVLLPAAPIHSTSRPSKTPPPPPPKTLYTGLSSLANLISWTSKANAAPPSNQQQLQQQAAAGPSAPKTPQNNATRQLPSTAPAKTSQEEHPGADDVRPIQFSNDHYVKLMMNSDAEKNKENRPLRTEATVQSSTATLPVNPPRKSFIERQTSAHRVSQISDSDVDSQPEPIVKQRAKRTREESEELPERDIAAAVDEDEDEEDDAFEQDRDRLPSRMRDSPPEIIQVTGAGKRARFPSRVVSHSRAGDVQSRQPRINATVSRFQPQASSDRVKNHDAVVPPLEEELTRAMSAYREAQDQAAQYQEAQEVPVQASQYQRVRETVRAQGAVHTGARKPTQRRTKWSEEETDGLIELIEQHGTSWSDLHRRGHEMGILHESRDQVALKDKARNIKVDYLIARSELPRNFDGISLGQKERDKVTARGLNPWRQEGEMVGEETLDMDGQPKGVFD
ncbi:hypothetical protein V497_00726 [Pseudogymnoascus sp. VKM F-4516 (FW-969)]|nr:hypothetical protein V497_00726 [Pseudogymnoascus sp. VKM F-4516 (FW-969)]